jgi:hypothetical protein
MLAQKIALVLFESEALKVANAFRRGAWPESLWPDRRTAAHRRPPRRHCRLPYSLDVADALATGLMAHAALCIEMLSCRAPPSLSSTSWPAVRAARWHCVYRPRPTHLLEPAQLMSVRAGEQPGCAPGVGRRRGPCAAKPS